jgi:hypothetical protein
VVLAVAGFAVTRAVRAGDDLVNTVQLTRSFTVPGEEARVSFNLARADGSVDVLIIDGRAGGDDAQVRALALGADLPAGRQTFTWDGLGDDGEPVEPGPYALEVILGDQGRDILPPGRIRVLPPSLPLDRGDG